MKQKESGGVRISAAAVKSYLSVLAGSLFVQIFCWAMYSYLSLRTGLFVLSAVVTALLYHFLQVEEQTGLSRRNVFFAAILSPFVLGLAVTVMMLLRHRNLQHLGAELDGVSPLTETLSLYSARLVINGVLLTVFAPIDRMFRREKPKKDENDP